MKPIVGILLVLTLAAAPPEDSKPRPVQVGIRNLQFSPQSVRIKAGQTIVWTNNDDRDHTVVADDKSFNSGTIASGDTFDHQFPKKGKFTYACKLHPRMKGVVIVE